MNRLLKKLTLLFVFGLSVPQVYAIDFQKDISWAEVLKRAQEQKKPIFVDAFATWCGPCKMMDRDVFPDEAVSAYFDTHFVSFKIDMESQEGEVFGKTYPVNAYPTLLFITPEGKLIKSNVGAIDASKLLDIGKYVKNPEDSEAGKMRKRYESGTRDIAFVEQLVLELQKIGESLPEATEQVLLHVGAEKIGADINYFGLLYETPFKLNSTLGVFFSKNFDRFLPEFETYAYQKLAEVIEVHLLESMASGNKSGVEDAKVYVQSTVKNEGIRTKLLAYIDMILKDRFKG